VTSSVNWKCWRLPA